MGNSNSKLDGEEVQAALQRASKQPVVANKQAAPLNKNSGAPKTAAERNDIIKQGAGQAMGQIVPILRIDIRPTNVDPGAPGGIQNMKRVLNAILNDEGNRITVKDENGLSLGVRNFNEIYPQVAGPRSDGSIQVEYHEQATLGLVGDVLWSLGWFFENGVFGVPRQLVNATLQAAGVTFVLETYYKQWLASILDQFNQRGLIPGYTNAGTGDDNWILETETIGRNIVVRPAGAFAYAPMPGDVK